MLPNFMCIGAQKSGTTWLYQNIRFHPEIWLPPVKELDYFSRSSSSPWLIILLTGKQVQRLWLHRLIRKAWRKKGKDTGWFLRYLFLPQNDKWYASLFSPSEEQICKGNIAKAQNTLDQF